MKKLPISNRQLTGLLAFFTACLIIIFSRIPASTTPNQQHILADAFQNQLSGIQVQGEGTVSQLLSDDTKGSQHQRFILRVSPEQTVLVAHNIDLAPRITQLKLGDTVEFFGVYEWNDKGGVIHWTHHDPNNRHPHGWLKHQGRIHQ